MFGSQANPPQDIGINRRFFILYWYHLFIPGSKVIVVYYFFEPGLGEIKLIKQNDLETIN